MRKLRLVCMYRAAAQGVKDLFDLKLIQYTLPQLQRALRQVLQRELPTRQCNKNTTACPEPKFMDLRCRLCWQLSQWPAMREAGVSPDNTHPHCPLLFQAHCLL